MSTSSNLINLPKLKGKINYSTWSFEAEGALQILLVWRYVQGSRTRPTAQETGETLATFKHRQDKWDLKDQTACLWIYANCVSKIRKSLLKLDLRTSKDVWDCLKKKYDALDEFTQFQEYITLRYDGKDIEKFCNMYKAKLQALKPTRLGISDYQAVYQFVMLMSPFFGTFARICHEHMRDFDHKITESTLDDMISTLIDESQALVNQAR